jgi:hypothetical protein
MQRLVTNALRERDEPFTGDFEIPSAKSKWKRPNGFKKTADTP